MPEGQNTEWKLTWRDEYLEWVCGFANADGGSLYIGKDDRGVTVGLTDSKRLMEDIPNKIRSWLGIVCKVSLHAEADGLECIRIDVEPSSYPVNYRGKYHYRAGATKQQLLGNELTRFIFEKTGMSWESVFVEGASIADFRHDSFDIFEEYALKSGRMKKEDFECSDEELLEKLGLANDGKITRAGVLLFHHAPERWLPLCYTKVGRFANDADILYQDEVHGSLIEQAVKLIDLLYTKYMAAPIVYDGVTRVETYPVPIDAVREMVYNALVHCNWARMIPIQISVYSDKLYVANQAVLPKDLTVQRLLSKHKSEPYNPLIAQVFYRAGFIESWGRGIEKIRKACEADGIPMASFELDADGVMVMLESAVLSDQKPDSSLTPILADGTRIPYEIDQREPDIDLTRKLLTLTRRQQAVLDLMIAPPEYTQQDMAKELGVSRSAIGNHVMSLKKAGLVGDKVGERWSILM